MSDEATAIERIREACAELRDSDDDTAKMLALRIDALCRAFLDSVLGDE